VSSGNSQRPPWDQRLTERWAREAREAANDPTRRERVSFREQLKSPWYWASLVALVAALFCLNRINAYGWPAGVAAALAYCLYFLTTRMSVRRGRR
jgi:hypothetical protein